MPRRYIDDDGGGSIFQQWAGGCEAMDDETVCIPPPFFLGLFLSPPQKRLEYLEKLGKREIWWRWMDFLFFWGSSTREDMWGKKMGSVKGFKGFLFV